MKCDLDPLRKAARASCSVSPHDKFRAGGQQEMIPPAHLKFPFPSEQEPQASKGHCDDEGEEGSHAAMPKKSFAVTAPFVASAIRVMYGSDGVRSPKAYRRTVSFPGALILRANSA